MPLSLQHHLVTPCVWLDLTHPWNSPHYGLWVNCYFFTIYMYKHCFLPLLLVLLTLWELAYDIFVPRFRPKTSSFRLPYQRHSSSANCARELFKGSNGSASLLVCTQKNFLVGGCGFFVSDVISEVVLGSFWLKLPGLGPNH